MDIKCSLYSEDSDDFPWDEDALKRFKKAIIESNIKCRMDDIFLLGFLRTGKYDLERALRLLKNYYSIRCSYPQYFKNLLPSKLEHFLSLNVMKFLTQPDHKGRYIFIIELNNWDISVGDVTDYLRTLLLFWDFQLNFHRTQANGVVFILNTEGLTPTHLSQFSPKFLNAFTSIIVGNTYQLRIKEIHYVNVNVMIKALLSLMIPFISVKIKKRIFLHDDVSTLHKFIHPQYLPLEFGGELPKFDPTDANKMIKENADFFRMNEEYLNIYEETGNEYPEEKLTDVKAFENKEHNEQLIQILKETEGKFNRFMENSEYFTAAVEKELDLEVKQLLLR